jgi:hypothetical protein
MEFLLGRNVVKVEEETAWITLHEPWTIEQLQQLLQQLTVVRREYNRVLLIVESLIDKPLTAEARRFLVRQQDDQSFTEIILISQSLLLRGTVALVHRARVLLASRPPNTPHFVRSVDEARQLLEKLRKLHRPKA